MKALRNLLLALSASCLLLLHTGCVSTKHTITSTTAVHDTLKVFVHDTAVHDHIVKETVRIHDTVITLPAYDVSQTFSAGQLTATHTAHSFTAGNGNLHSTVTVDTAGRITIDCRDDSLRAVIAMLTEVTTAQTDSIAHLSRSTTAESSDASVITYDKLVKSKWPLWLKITVICVIAFLVLEVVIRTLKFFKFIP